MSTWIIIGCPPRLNVISGSVCEDVSRWIYGLSKVNCHPSMDRYYGMNVCVPLPKFLCWDPSPQDDGIRRRDFSEVMSTLIEEGPQNSLTPFLHMRTKQEVNRMKRRREPSPKVDHAGTLISDFWPPELWEINFLCYRPPGLWYVVITVQTNQRVATIQTVESLNRTKGRRRKNLYPFLPDLMIEMGHLISFSPALELGFVLLTLLVLRASDSN